MQISIVIRAISFYVYIPLLSNIIWAHFIIWLVWLPRGLILEIRPSRGLKPSGPELGWDRRESHSLDWPNQFCLHYRVSLEIKHLLDCRICTIASRMKKWRTNDVISSSEYIYNSSLFLYHFLRQLLPLSLVCSCDIGNHEWNTKHMFYLISQ